MLCPLDLWILEIWAHSLWFVSKQRLEPSRNIGICGYTSLESPRNKIRGKKLQMTARLGSSAHTKMLIYIQGWSCFCYVCIKKHEIKKKKDIHLVQSRRRLVRVRACICLHLCMSYLCVHLRHWAAGYAALKGCVSAAIPLSLSLSRSVFLAHTWTPLPVLSAVCIVHHHRSVHLYSIINALS